MSKCVKIEYEGKTYELGFNKRTVQETENMGFIANKIDEMPGTMIPLLFKCSFLMNHRFTKDAVKEEMYRRLTRKEDLISILGELYNEPLMELIAEPDDDEKKVQWTMEK